MNSETGCTCAMLDDEDAQAGWTCYWCYENRQESRTVTA